MLLIRYYFHQSAMDKGILYKQLYDYWIESKSIATTKLQAQQECNDFWNSIKNDEDYAFKVQQKHQELRILKNNPKGTITN